VSNQEKLLELVSQRIPGDVSGHIKKEVVETTKKEVKKETNDKDILNAEKEYNEALAYVKDMIAPAFMKVSADKLKINNTIAKTFFVYAYPTFLE
jgi:hypothetical protein|tara:strand:+ start:410 stop:694 length:285 start_codon:yes stop_codon:yes gene_type:complete